MSSRAAGDGGERHAAGERLRGGDQVRDDAVVLAREHRAGPAEAGLDLVGDEHDAVLVSELLDRLEVPGRRHDEAALALDRLGDDGGDVVRTDLGEHGLLQGCAAPRHRPCPRPTASGRGTATGTR